MLGKKKQNLFTILVRKEEIKKINYEWRERLREPIKERYDGRNKNGWEQNLEKRENEDNLNCCDVGSGKAQHLTQQSKSYSSIQYSAIKVTPIELSFSLDD